MCDCTAVADDAAGIRREPRLLRRPAGWNERAGRERSASAGRSRAGLRRAEGAHAISASYPSRSSASASARAWVLLPEPSMPEKPTTRGRRGGGRVDGLAREHARELVARRPSCGARRRASRQLCVLGERGAHARDSPGRVRPSRGASARAAAAAARERGGRGARSPRGVARRESSSSLATLGEVDRAPPCRRRARSHSYPSPGDEPGCSAARPRELGSRETRSRSRPARRQRAEDERGALAAASTIAAALIAGPPARRSALRSTRRRCRRREQDERYAATRTRRAGRRRQRRAEARSVLEADRDRACDRSRNDRPDRSRGSASSCAACAGRAATSRVHEHVVDDQPDRGSGQPDSRSAEPRRRVITTAVDDVRCHLETDAPRHDQRAVVRACERVDRSPRRQRGRVPSRPPPYRDP